MSSEVKALLSELGIAPNKKLGQNFLTGHHVIDQIVQTVKDLKPALVVEVGPGLGALTHGLKNLTCPLKLIELDRTLCAYWKQRDFDVLHGDALKVDWQTLGLTAKTVLVSNLPFQISSSLVIERSQGPPEIEAMVLMFQKEVAQRLLSRSSSKDYGLLSVVAQTFWRMDLVLEAGPNEFYPPPQVASRVLRFQRLDSPVIDKAGYLAFVKAGFAQRRKKVGKSLVNFAKSCGMSEQQAELAMAEVKIDGHQRAENLSVNDWQNLFLRIKSGRGN